MEIVQMSMQYGLLELMTYSWSKPDRSAVIMWTAGVLLYLQHTHTLLLRRQSDRLFFHIVDNVQV